MDTPDLTRYDRGAYRPAGSWIYRALWFIVNAAVVECRANPSSRLRVWALRLFGARVGRNVIIRPGASIKYPRLLHVGDNSWIGRDVLIDNLARVTIGDNVCISQGAMIECGNHDWQSVHFDLHTRPVVIGDGAWICAKALVCPGLCGDDQRPLKIGKSAVLTAGSVATADLPAMSICHGNPAIVRARRTLA